MTTTLDRFLDLACLTYAGNDSPDRRAEAERLLAAEPGLTATSIHAAAAVGDVAGLQALLAEEGGRATVAGGPRGWVPLLYLCYSRVHPDRPGWDPLEAARLLLSAGADPNSFTTITECRFTAVTGAIGVGEGGIVAQPSHPQARALVELLLDAGADVNHSQALYNTHFLPDDSWLQLFLDRGLAAASPANWDDRGQLKILDYLLGQAAQQGFTDRVALLLKHGAAPDGRNQYNKRSHLENARLNGHLEIAKMLESHGATALQLTGEEQFRAACLAGDEPEARRLLAVHPGARGQPGTLTAAADHGKLPAVRLALSLGLPIDGAAGDGFTPLHHAARAGQLAVAQELVARGAPLSARDRIYGGTPLNHASHFLEGWPTPARKQTADFLLRQTEQAAVELIERAFAALNARDIDGALACLHPDFDCPNVAEGGRLRGHDQVRAHWTEQWQTTDPRVEARYFRPGKAGGLAVEVRQLVRSQTGEVLADQTVTQVYTLQAGLIRRMDIERS